MKIKKIIIFAIVENNYMINNISNNMHHKHNLHVKEMYNKRYPVKQYSE